MNDSRMAEHRPQSSPKVTLEQLIQLKRREKPAASFWDDFDRELHRRQLASLVTIEPWHRRAVRAIAAVSRRFAPAGAGVAALALVGLAALRVGQQAPVTPDESLTAAEIDGKVFLLPEEAIRVSAVSPQDVRTRAGVEEFRGDVRSAPPEFGSGLAARRFTTVAAPVTFSSGDDASAIYSANALTAGTVLRTLVAAAPESL